MLLSFHRAGDAHMPGDMPGHGGQLRSDITDFGESWDEIIEDDTSLQENALPADLPETHPIGLPSTFGMRFLLQRGLKELAHKERQLREGQMNDALQGIRTGIGYKSLLYRAKVRNASSYRSRLRSFDDVHVADEGVRKYVHIYMQARQASERLYDEDDEDDVAALAAFRSRYRNIQTNDLKASTAVLEAFTPGLRNEHSAWFWNVADTMTAHGSTWMHDCEYQVL